MAPYLALCVRLTLSTRSLIMFTIVHITQKKLVLSCELGGLTSAAIRTQKPDHLNAPASVQSFHIKQMLPRGTTVSAMMK